MNVRAMTLSSWRIAAVRRVSRVRNNGCLDARV